MIKLLMNLAKIIVATFIALLFNSCKHDIDFDFGQESIKGNGNVITENRNLSGFEKVTVNRALDCEIIQSNTFKVVVEADENLIKGIETYVENGTLKITSKYNNYHNVASKKITVYLPIISGLESSSGSNLTNKGVIKSNNIYLKSSSAADMNVVIESDKITVETTSGSEIKVKGKAIALETASSSGSSIDAEELLVNEVNAQSSSGSETVVNPILKLSAKASSGSSIGYIKKPNQIDIEESSGGSVGKE
ncbi:head GIN domain-containing protein [Flavobacterium sp.]|uniref:head GIN domain-containing protein n=1 Tax=Flavobacterium sp. TaxID=239 RepID=UPI00286E14A3|nr:head GIN domain-containing protein [Flavobacterium sp.]